MVTLGLYIEKYVEFLRTDEGRSWLTDASDHKKFFQSIYGEEAIKRLTESSFYSSLERIRSVPQAQAISVARRLVSEHEINAVAQELNFFIRGEATLEARFDRIKDALPEMPQTLFMEIGMLTAPRELCLWDENARRTIVFVGHSRMHGLDASAFGDAIDGWRYVACKAALNLIKEQIRAHRRERIDFVDAWLFTRFMCEKEIPPTFSYPKA